MSTPISYLAKDYPSFIRMLEDRARVTAPGWDERSPADPGVTLLELMAFAADNLSYYQDAIATEAYLGTARLRRSLRRHARLLDYRLDEGDCARAVLHVHVEDDETEVAPGAAFATRAHAAEQPWDIERIDASRIVFTALHGLRLRRAHNHLRLDDGGHGRTWLRRGATTAALAGAHPALAAGDLILFESLRDITARHAVRLIAPPIIEPGAGDQAITRLRWSREDALPFDLVIDHRDPDAPWSIARGNLVLCEHGYELAAARIVVGADPTGFDVDTRGRPVAVARAYDHARARARSLADALRPEPRAALPCVTVRELRPDRAIAWRQVPDLFDSGRFARDFVVELEQPERFRIRFGDGELGRALLPGATLEVQWRTGGGPDGNVGADNIVRIVGPPPPGWQVRNPLPARGGRAAETAADIRRDAPEAYRRLERGVTADDFAALATRVPGIAQAAARFAWSGSWATAVVHARPDDGDTLDDELRDALTAYLRRRAIAGVSVEIRDPTYVPVELAVRAGVGRGRHAAAIRAAIADALAAADPRDNRSFTRPRSFDFGEAVYLAPIVARIAAIDGVLWVEPQVFGRAGEPGSALAGGALVLDATEIARLDEAAGGVLQLELVVTS